MMCYLIFFRLLLSYCMEVNQSLEGRLEMSHNLKLGITKSNNYGLSLATISTLPEEIVNVAKNMSPVISLPPKVCKCLSIY